MAADFDAPRLSEEQSKDERAGAEAERSPTHGLSEDELRALIAQDLRAFVRRPLADPERSRIQPFLLDRMALQAS